jgi:hypothetical protein
MPAWAETGCFGHGGGLGEPVRQPERVVGVAAEADRGAALLVPPPEEVRVKR